VAGTTLIRQARLADLDTILAIGASELGFEVSEDVFFYPRKLLAQWLSRPHEDVLLVAEDSGTIMGFLFCSVKTSTVTIENLAVTPSGRRHGTAAALLAECFAILQAGHPNVDHVNALVREENPALEFFTHQGFKVGHSFTWLTYSLTDVPDTEVGL
jgi:ribosomal protein S18 acetylase RimI-like enzyme